MVHWAVSSITCEKESESHGNLSLSVSLSPSPGLTGVERLTAVFSLSHWVSARRLERREGCRGGVGQTNEAIPVAVLAGAATAGVEL